MNQPPIYRQLPAVFFDHGISLIEVCTSDDVINLVHGYVSRCGVLPHGYLSELLHKTSLALYCLPRRFGLVRGLGLAGTMMCGTSLFCRAQSPERCATLIIVNPSTFSVQNSTNTIIMLSTRTLARATARIITRPQQSRLTFQSRFVSGTSKGTDSAFFKEREAVKKHAAESSGSSFPSSSSRWIIC